MENKDLPWLDDMLEEAMLEEAINNAVPTVDELLSLGYNRPVAEAFNGQELKRSYILDLSPMEAFEEYLIWEGMSGRARTLIRAYESCVNAASLGRGDFGFDLPEDAR